MSGDCEASPAQVALGRVGDDHEAIEAGARAIYSKPYFYGNMAEAEALSEAALGAADRAYDIRKEQTEGKKMNAREKMARKLLEQHKRRSRGASMQTWETLSEAQRETFLNDADEILESLGLLNG